MSCIKSYFAKISNKIGQPSDHIYIGVELEVLSKAENELAKYSQDKAIFKFDSSIEGVGFEIVTAPMSLDYQLEYWEGLIEQFGSKINTHQSCGMHVHLSRKPLSQLQIDNIMSFLNNPSNKLQIDTMAGRSSNRFCKRRVSDFSRYVALNLTSETIEFRLFASSNKIEEIASRIEFCHALTVFCGSNEIDEWEYFVEWLKYQPYSHLKEWLDINYNKEYENRNRKEWLCKISEEEYLLLYEYEEWDVYEEEINSDEDNFFMFRITKHDCFQALLNAGYTFSEAEELAVIAYLMYENNNSLTIDEIITSIVNS